MLVDCLVLYVSYMYYIYCLALYVSYFPHHQSVSLYWHLLIYFFIALLYLLYPLMTL